MTTTTETTTAITRKQYMNKDISHHEYYLYIANILNLQPIEDSLLKRVQYALNNKDEHLNTIPLKEWDNAASWIISTMPNETRSKLYSIGENVSLSTIVCALKNHAIHCANKA